MARSNHIPLKNLTRFTGKPVIVDLQTTDESGKRQKALPKKTSRARWTACKNFFIRVYLKHKQHRLDQAAHQQLMSLDENCLRDIGVTFDLQTPGDHRLRVVTTYKVAQPRSITDTSLFVDQRINGEATQCPKILSKKTGNLRGAAGKSLPVRAYRAKKQQIIDRAAFRRLLKLDDDGLKDIGVSREDVIWASRQPVSVSASLELQKIARDRHKTTK